MSGTVLWVALGGAGGATLRYLLGIQFGGTLIGTGDIGLRFPWATLLINVIGCFAIGLVWGGYAHTQWFESWGRAFLLVGVLGGFTTFSTFSLECLRLLEHGRFGAAAGYILLSVLGCLLMVWLGRQLAAVAN